MNLDLTRRTLLRLSGASSVAAAAATAARAEGSPRPTGPTFANRTPMRVGIVTLRVRHLDQITDFYRDVIGLRVIERSAMEATLGADGIKLLVLEAHPQATAPSAAAAGLYHTAFLMPTRKDLARWLVHAAINRVPLSGFADHRVSESVYLDDPEGNGIEVYADRDPSLWQWDAGVVTMATDQLDTDDLVSLTDIRKSDYASAPDGLRIGHVHLRVGDLAAADDFYQGAIGLDPTRRRNGASFLSSGHYHHHLGMNTWQSAGAGPRDEAANGLAWFSFNIEKPDLFAAQEERLHKAGAKVVAIANGVETTDPWGTRVRLIKL